MFIEITTTAQTLDDDQTGINGRTNRIDVSEVINIDSIIDI
jgi:hypothetical protein